MYTPDIYKNENPEEIRKFLKENSFGILINQTNGKLCATHIPLELDTNKEGKGNFIRTHFKRKPAMERFH